jgi:hypothetical protein
MATSYLTSLEPIPVSLGTGDGVTTQFALGDIDDGVIVANVTSVFRNDWQGNQPLTTTPRTNLCTYSQIVGSTGWTLTDVTAAVNATFAPDGSGTGNFISETAVTGLFGVSQNITVVPNSTYTWSVFLKAGVRTACRIQWEDGSNNGAYADIDLNAGVVVDSGALGTGVVSSTSILQLSNGWFRASVTGIIGSAATVGNGNIYLANPTGNLNYAGTVGSGLYAWGAQLELGSAPSALLPTTSYPLTAADYTVSTTAPRTNVIPFANVLSDAAVWGFTQCAVSTSAVVTPDGNTSAWTITLASSGLTNSYVYLQTTIIPTQFATQTLTASVYLKMGTSTANPIRLYLRDGLDANVAYADFDFNAGAPTPQVGSYAPVMNYVGAGWFRCSITGTFPITAAAGLHFYIDPSDGAGNAGQTYYVYDPQIEFGIVATPFIATQIAAVTVLGNASIYGTGQVIFSTAPVLGAILTWTGSYLYQFIEPVTPVWEDTIMSQYANSPTLMALISNFEQYIDQTANINNFFNFVFNINTAQGYGLDVWGRILGVNRVLQVQAGTYFGFSGAGGPFNASGDSFGGGPAPTGANPWYSGAPTTTNFSLTDSSFRTLLLAKALSNISNGSVQSVNQILINLFLTPVAGRTGNAYVTDALNMTMTYTFAVRPVLTPVEVAIVSQSGVLPKPTGVTATVVQI